MFGAGANMAVSPIVAMASAASTRPSTPARPCPAVATSTCCTGSFGPAWALVYEPAAVVFHRHPPRRRRPTAPVRLVGPVAHGVRDQDLPPRPGRTSQAPPAGPLVLPHPDRAGAPGHLRRGPDARTAALAELRGGVGGLPAPMADRSVGWRSCAAPGASPTVAILPWGDVVEDYTGPLGLTLDDYATTSRAAGSSGSSRSAPAGVDTVVVLWSTTVRPPGGASTSRPASRSGSCRRHRLLGPLRSPPGRPLGDGPTTRPGATAPGSAAAVAGMARTGVPYADRHAAAPGRGPPARGLPALLARSTRRDASTSASRSAARCASPCSPPSREATAPAPGSSGCAPSGRSGPPPA